MLEIRHRAQNARVTSRVQGWSVSKVLRKVELVRSSMPMLARQHAEELV